MTNQEAFDLLMSKNPCQEGEKLLIKHKDDLLSFYQNSTTKDLKYILWAFSFLVTKSEKQFNQINLYLFEHAKKNKPVKLINSIKTWLDNPTEENKNLMINNYNNDYDYDYNYDYYYYNDYDYDYDYYNYNYYSYDYDYQQSLLAALKSIIPNPLTYNDTPNN